VADLAPARIHPLLFETDALPFALPGMSDVMPYRSRTFSSLSAQELEVYRRRWREHVTTVVDDFRPDIIHVHHIWILASMMKELFAQIPVVNHCHATGLRQASLCPELAAQVREGCRRNERFLVLHGEHGRALAGHLGVEAPRIRQVGAGYRSDLFHTQGRKCEPHTLLYAGKYSAAKGLPQLLNVFEGLLTEHPSLRLHVAGAGAGAEADALRERMEAMGPSVILHGMLDQAALSDLMRRTRCFVLPSFYEGLPLVLVEAYACGNRLVTTALDGIKEQLAPHLGDALELVGPPAMCGPDTPRLDAIAEFEAALRAALKRSLGAPVLSAPKPDILHTFTWDAVFARVEAVWRELL
jgi:glycosyltransferase involved in cell wall biosynthesis